MLSDTTPLLVPWLRQHPEERSRRKERNIWKRSVTSITMDSAFGSGSAIFGVLAEAPPPSKSRSETKLVSLKNVLVAAFVA